MGDEGFAKGCGGIRGKRQGGRGNERAHLRRLDGTEIGQKSEGRSIVGKRN